MPTDAPPVLACGELTVHFGGVHALDGLELDVRLGQRVAIIGANGSGKSTLVNVCSGVVKPSGGTVRVNGRMLAAHTPEAFARAGVGRTFQNVRLFEELTVFDNVALGLNRRLRTVFGVPTGCRRRIRSEVNAAVSEVGLDAPLWRPVSSLSYGQRKRVELARLLVGHAKLLLLDEPTAGVSRVDTPAMAATLYELAGEERALVFVEHDLDLVEAVADRVVCVDAGRVVADGTFADVIEDPQVKAAVLSGGAR